MCRGETRSTLTGMATQLHPYQITAVVFDENDHSGSDGAQLYQTWLGEWWHPTVAKDQLAETVQNKLRK